MKQLHHYLIEYSESHQNPRNIRIHTLCVPLIYWSIFAFVWFFSPLFSVGIMLLVLSFYLKLGIKPFTAMLLVNLLCAATYVPFLNNRPLILITSILVFVLSWLGQFYGHHMEKKKPSFLSDVFFLLIGPLWILKKFGFIK